MARAKSSSTGCTAPLGFKAKLSLAATCATAANFLSALVAELAAA